MSARKLHGFSLTAVAPAGDSDAPAIGDIIAELHRGIEPRLTERKTFTANVPVTYNKNEALVQSAVGRINAAQDADSPWRLTAKKTSSWFVEIRFTARPSYEIPETVADPFQ